MQEGLEFKAVGNARWHSDARVSMPTMPKP